MVTKGAAGPEVYRVGRDVEGIEVDKPMGKEVIGVELDGAADRGAMGAGVKRNGSGSQQAVSSETKCWGLRHPPSAIQCDLHRRPLQSPAGFLLHRSVRHTMAARGSGTTGCGTLLAGNIVGELIGRWEWEVER